MPKSCPFLDDPRNAVREQIALAVASPLEEVRAIHLRMAEHHAAVAKESGLTLDHPLRLGTR